MENLDLQELVDELSHLPRRSGGRLFYPIDKNTVLDFFISKHLKFSKSWRCFHCDEVFTDRESAWAHFGTDGFCESDVPACVDPLRTDERARLTELRKAQEYAEKCRRELDEISDKADLLEQYQDEIGRYFGNCGGLPASTPHQAWLILEAAQNEAEMWKEKFEEAEKKLEVLA